MQKMDMSDDDPEEGMDADDEGNAMAVDAQPTGRPLKGKVRALLCVGLNA